MSSDDSEDLGEPGTYNPADFLDNDEDDYAALGPGGYKPQMDNDEEDYSGLGPKKEEKDDKDDGEDYSGLGPKKSDEEGEKETDAEEGKKHKVKSKFGKMFEQKNLENEQKKKDEEMKQKENQKNKENNDENLKENNDDKNNDDDNLGYKSNNYNYNNQEEQEQPENKMVTVSLQIGDQIKKISILTNTKCTFETLIRRAIDDFNKNFEAEKTKLRLKEDIDYYIIKPAKKTGKPKKDLPKFDIKSVLGNVFTDRFTLCWKDNEEDAMSYFELDKQKGGCKKGCIIF